MRSPIRFLPGPMSVQPLTVPSSSLFSPFLRGLVPRLLLRSSDFVFLSLLPFRRNGTGRRRRLPFCVSNLRDLILARTVVCTPERCDSRFRSLRFPGVVPGKPSSSPALVDSRCHHPRPEGASVEDDRGVSNHKTWGQGRWR